MGAENVQDSRVDRVDCRRPSEVFLALWRYYVLDQRSSSSVDDFAKLADVWAQIQSMEKGQKPWYIDKLPFVSDNPKPALQDPKKQGVVSVYYEVKEPGHINVAIDCPEGMPTEARQAVLRRVLDRWHAEADKAGREGQAPPLQGDAEPVSNLDHGRGPSAAPRDDREKAPSDDEAAEGPRDPSAAPRDDSNKAPRDDKEEAPDDSNKAPTLSGPWSSYKNEIMARLEKARKEDGLTLAQVVAASGGKLTDLQLLDMLNRSRMPMAKWDVLSSALAALGYPEAQDPAPPREKGGVSNG